MFTVYLT